MEENLEGQIDRLEGLYRLLRIARIDPVENASDHGREVINIPFRLTYGRKCLAEQFLRPRREDELIEQVLLQEQRQAIRPPEGKGAPAPLVGLGKTCPVRLDILAHDATAADNNLNWELGELRGCAIWYIDVQDLFQCWADGLFPCIP